MTGGNRSDRRKLREARRERHVEINIVSLIDIFAILVFYLLVNALVVQVLPSPQALKLPESAAEEQPRQTVVVLVTKDDILVDQRRVMTTVDALNSTTPSLTALKTDLQSVPLMQIEGQAGQLTRGEINIMADKAIPYHLLKKIIATCTEARFASISLAVIQKESQMGSGGQP